MDNQLFINKLTVTPTPTAKKINPIMINIIPRDLAKSGPTDDL